VKKIPSFVIIERGVTTFGWELFYAMDTQAWIDICFI
jgi:hypothetical protein